MVMGVQIRGQVLMGYLIPCFSFCQIPFSSSSSARILAKETTVNPSFFPSLKKGFTVTKNLSNVISYNSFLAEQNECVPVHTFKCQRGADSQPGAGVWNCSEGMAAECYHSTLAKEEWALHRNS